MEGRLRKYQRNIYLQHIISTCAISIYQSQYLQSTKRLPPFIGRTTQTAPRLHIKNADSSTYNIHGLSLQCIQYISRQCISVFNVFIKNSLQRRLLLSSLFTEEKHSKSHLSGNVEGRYKRVQSSQVWAHYIENGMLKHRKKIRVSHGGGVTHARRRDWRGNAHNECDW